MHISSAHFKRRHFWLPWMEAPSVLFQGNWDSRDLTALYKKNWDKILGPVQVLKNCARTTFWWRHHMDKIVYGPNSLSSQRPRCFDNVILHLNQINKIKSVVVMRNHPGTFSPPFIQRRGNLLCQSTWENHGNSWLTSTKTQVSTREK